MRRWLTSPFALPLAALAGALAVAAFVLVLALAQPWLGLRLVAPPAGAGLAVAAVAPAGPAARAGIRTGDSITVIGGQVVGATDLIEEPDMLPSFADYGAFLADQARLAAALRLPAGVELVLAPPRGSHVVQPAAWRPPGSLPATFWIQLLVGSFGFCAGAWVWGLRRGGVAEGFLLLAGVGLMLSAHSAAIYSTRELALPQGLFRVLSALNHLGALVFGMGMIGLFLIYPVRLVAQRWLVLPVAVLGLWWLVNQLRWLPDPAVGFQLPVALALAAIAVCVALQYRATRPDPRARAALRWFGLAVLAGAGAFVTTTIVPTLLGFEAALSQGFAFLFFLPIYGGLALGVARYRLFELEDWAFRVLFYMGAMVVLVVLDAALIALVAMERAPAFGLSLLAVALVYLPMRDALARRLLRGHEWRLGGTFRAVTDVALTPPGESRVARWQHLLAAEFDPQRIEPLSHAVARAQLVEDGAALDLPGVDTLPPLRLVWARHGRALFSPADLARAAELVTMLGEAAASRHAYETGVAEERARIAQDMHDNIGIQLMGALHSTAPGRKDALIRETLSDLRDIVSNANRSDLGLDELLADLRATLGEHLSAAGVALDWESRGQGPARLAPRLAHAMRSILREAVGNALRHSGGNRVRVRVEIDDRDLRLSVEDNGQGLGQPGTGGGSGNGLSNMRTRATGLGGSFSIAPAAGGGTRVEARLPLSGSKDP